MTDPARGPTTEELKRPQRELHRETHIVSPTDLGVALCGKRRDRPLRAGHEDSECTCVVCLDVWTTHGGRAWWSTA